MKPASKLSNAPIISKKIKEICKEAGFFRTGISEIVPLEKEEVYLRKWIDEGMNADMKWMEKNISRRTNPLEIMPDARYVISLSYLYDTPYEHNNNPKISRYAWGKMDYHKVLKKKLKSVCKEIESLAEGIKTKYFVDDGPFMDKVWAVRSGIGWMGKHTNVINAGAGSFFFIAGIIINEQLKADTPAEDLCGTCRICVDACPTGAIYEEYKLDSNLCISYHTIENRGEIPDYIDLNGWIFGCDICQDVCPYNKKKFFTEDEAFFPKLHILNKSREELLSMTEEEFNREFSCTPVKRTKYSGWRRNLEKIKI